MPLDEEGAKWSCEPCIRGHRSSKCQHFDRLMMKVPKAGRPLAKCPHPKGSCSCERVYAFMVRIPKGSTCLCRPVYQVPANSTEAASLPVNPTAPSIPSTPAAVGRIQKQSRKPSNFQSPSDNVIRALDSELMRSDFNKDIRLSRQSTGPNYNPVSGRGTPAVLQGQNQGLEKKSVSETTLGACCAGKSEPIAPTPAPQQPSCCGGPPASEDANRRDTTVSGTGFNPTWTGSNNPKGLLWNANLPNSNHAFENDTYTATNQKASSSSAYRNESETGQPMPPRAFQTMNVNYQGDIGTSSMDQFILNSSTYPFDMSFPFVNDNNHDCSCGDRCQCLGCASHPFNETTRQHVQEMGYMMAVKEDEDKPSSFARTRSPPVLETSNQNYPVSSNANQSLTDETALLPGLDNTLASSNFASDQFMQPSEYYTLEYPVGFNPCSDTTGTCQCGNDCSCVGCLTHSGHDGVTLDAVPAESQRVFAANSGVTPQDFRQYFQQTTGIPRSLDQYSPTVQSPPIVKAPLV